MKAPLVSIIIPVWNVSQYINKSLESLFLQTYYNIEYIIINDQTPDDSFVKIDELLKAYPHRRDQVRILNHIENQGLGTSRCDGQKVAIGDYILNCDSDDWFEASYVEELVTKADSGKFDIVICDYFISTHNHDRYIKQEYNGDGFGLIKKIYLGELQGFLWNKLIRRCILTDNDIYNTPSINMWEDILLMSKVCLYAKSVGYVSKSLIHYNQTNVNSYSTKRLSNKSLRDIEYVISYIDRCYLTSNPPIITDNVLNVFKLRAKLYYLTNTRGCIRRRYNSLYPETKKLCFTMRLIPIYSNIIHIAAYFNLYLLIDFIWRSISILKHVSYRKLRNEQEV